MKARCRPSVNYEGLDNRWLMDSKQSINRYRNAFRRRWVHWLNNQRIHSLADQVQKNSPALEGAQPVVVFNASTRLSGLSQNAAFSLLTSWALQLAGVPVIQLVCHSGLSRCVLGTNRDDPQAPPPCKECRAQSDVNFAKFHQAVFEFHADEELADRISGLNISQLEQVEYQGIPLGTLVLPTIRWVLRCHHLQDDAPTQFLYRQFLLSACSTAQAFLDLLQECTPRAVLVFNGMFFPEAVLRWIGNQRGIPVISHEVGLQPFTGYFTTGEATAYPIDIPANFELSSEQNQKLDDYLAHRFQGNFTMAGVQFWPEMQSLSPDFLQKAAGFKQIVPVFTNVIFDTSQSHANVVFEHMFAWLDQVLEVVRSHPETLFVIRAHPDESRPGKASRESVADWIASNSVLDLPNVLFVDSNQYISSYELIQRSKFVMVYNSTIGLEASLMGAPVLCAGKARFTQLETVFFPQTVDAYRALTEDFLTSEKILIPPQYLENARRFLYYQLYKTSLPFSEFLEEDGIWRGYVALKPFSWQDLQPAHSETIRTILNGILDQQPFYLE